MTPDDRQLILGLFDRMRGLGAVQKDRDADALISDSIRRLPDAPYLLVQSVLVQENALEQSEQRIRDLEAQVADLERRGQPTQQQASGGSFLGGLFGRSGAGSVPSAGRAPLPTSYAQPAGGGGAWNRGAAEPQRPWGSQQPGQQQPWGQPQAQAPAGGGFMRQAMATAAGVAGGMLAANALSNMFNSGGQAHAAPATADPAAASNLEPLQQQEPQQATYDDASNDPGNADAPAYQDASYADDNNDPGGDWGGGGDDV